VKDTDDVHEADTVRLTDPKAIRALAHPARLAVIDELYAGRELTATEAADVAGLSPSAMSYHLRSLERAGIVVRTDSATDGRERRYRAAGRYLRAESGNAAAGRVASAALGETMLAQTLEEYGRWVERDFDAESGWNEVGGMTSTVLWLTPEEQTDLTERINSQLDPYQQRKAADRPSEARRVRLTMLSFPNDPRVVGSGT